MSQSVPPVGLLLLPADGGGLVPAVVGPGLVGAHQEGWPGPVARHRGKEGVMAVRWEPVGTAESDSEPGTMHDIKRREGDGHLGCDCLAYRFARGEAKTCKHILAWRAGAAAMTAASSVRATVRQASGETFTITRRAIATGAGIRF